VVGELCFQKLKSGEIRESLETDGRCWKIGGKICIEVIAVAAFADASFL
jgi:hypothetical protein